MAQQHTVRQDRSRAVFYARPPLYQRETHNLNPGEFLQGALLHKRIFERAYVVVVPQPSTADEWCPQVVDGGDKNFKRHF